MMNQRKLSDILIEIAMQGLSSPRHGHSVVMHPLMWLAHVAWNREVRDPNYMLEETPRMLSKFDIPSDTLQSHLVSCSGLVRRAMADAYVSIGLRTGNPLAFRSALDIWCHDFSAKALRDQYQNRTRLIATAPSINSITNSILMPGDLAVTSDGIHVLAHLADSKWIEADPGIMRVVTDTVPSENGWFTVPVKIVRWTCLDSNKSIHGTREEIARP